jgi:uncharacterized protein YbaR (Trm112 family)
MFSDHLKTCPNCRARLYLQQAKEKAASVRPQNQNQKSKLDCPERRVKLQELGKLVKGL